MINRKRTLQTFGFILALMLVAGPFVALAQTTGTNGENATSTTSTGASLGGSNSTATSTTGNQNDQSTGGQNQSMNGQSAGTTTTNNSTSSAATNTGSTSPTNATSTGTDNQSGGSLNSSSTMSTGSTTVSGANASSTGTSTATTTGSNGNNGNGGYIAEQNGIGLSFVGLNRYVMRQDQPLTISTNVQNASSNENAALVQINILDQNGNQVSSTTSMGQSFTQNGLATLTATAPSNLSNGQYEVQIVVLSSDGARVLAVFNDVANFTVIGSSNGNGGSNGSNGSNGNSNSTSTATSTDNNGSDSNSTSTATTTINHRELHDEIMELQRQITILQQTINNWNGGGNNGNGNGTTTNPGQGGAMIMPTNASVSSGGSIDFNGRNFGNEETVMITANGQNVGSAHADGGGNFSTGSMRVQGSTGTVTYAFKGMNSGRTANATVNIL